MYADISPLLWGFLKGVSIKVKVIIEMHLRVCYECRPEGPKEFDLQVQLEEFL